MGEPKSYIVLGIDPGTATTGYGVIQKKGFKTAYLAHGIIKTRPQKTDSQRLAQISSALNQLIRQFQPDQIAVERLFFSKNIKTAMSVSQARGVILMTCAQFNLEAAEYSPNEVKLAIAGHGHADKSQIQKMVKVLLGLSEIPKPDDAADALAIALCHVQTVPQLLSA